MRVGVALNVISVFQPVELSSSTLVDAPQIGADVRACVEGVLNRLGFIVGDGGGEFPRNVFYALFSSVCMLFECRVPSADRPGLRLTTFFVIRTEYHFANQGLFEQNGDAINKRQWSWLRSQTQCCFPRRLIERIGIILVEIMSDMRGGFSLTGKFDLPSSIHSSASGRELAFNFNALRAFYESEYSFASVSSIRS